MGREGKKEEGAAKLFKFRKWGGGVFKLLSYDN